MRLIDERVISMERPFTNNLALLSAGRISSCLSTTCSPVAFERRLRICVGGVVDSLAESFGWPNLESRKSRA